MDITGLSDDALKSALARLGREMTASSSTRASAIEKDRVVYWKEAFRRGIAGYPCRKKYRIS